MNSVPATALPATVLLDGDLDPAGTQYTINGTGNLEITNQTIGLTVDINGFRDQDLLWVKLPGGTVNADLSSTGPGTINVDSTARERGINPTAMDKITVANGAGNVKLQAVSGDTSVLNMYNTLILQNACSMPQDSLTLTVPTTFKLSPTGGANTQHEDYFPITENGLVYSVYYVAPSTPSDQIVFDSDTELDNEFYGPGSEYSLPAVLAGSLMQGRVATRLCRLHTHIRASDAATTRNEFSRPGFPNTILPD